MIRIESKTANRAVSPVIGVVLMVAITVILAAVIGVFAMGLGAELGTTAPTVSVSLEDGSENHTFVIEHNSGDPLALAEEFTVVWNGTAAGENTTWDPAAFAAGEDATVNLSATDLDVEPGDTGDVQLRHDPSGALVAVDEVTLGEEPS